jgi:hypothetical protein
MRTLFCVGLVDIELDGIHWEVITSLFKFEYREDSSHMDSAFSVVESSEAEIVSSKYAIASSIHPLF